MAKIEKLITQQNSIINSTFTIKQIIVKNTTQFTVYVKFSGGNPTATDYDCVIQPNSDFTSGLLGTNIITVFTNATKFDNPAGIDCYDALVSSPNNTPYRANQTIENLEKYPFKYSGLCVSLVNTINLPLIKFDSFSPVYFIIKCNLPNTLINIVGLDVIGYTFGNGIIQYVPIDLTQSNSFALNVGGAIGQGINLTVYVITSPNTYYVNQYNREIVLINSAVTGFVGACVSVVTAPAYIYSINLRNHNAPTPVNYNITLVAYTVDDLDLKITLFTQNFVGVIAANISLLIPETVNKNSRYQFIFVEVINNLALPSPIEVKLDLFNY